jgi:hypothetical protein
MFVIDGDFYGTGRNYPSEVWKGRSVLIKFRWNLGKSALGLNGYS